MHVTNKHVVSQIIFYLNLSLGIKFIPRTFILHKKTIWRDARETCLSLGGTLSDISDISCVMDILDQLPQLKNITIWNDMSTHAPDLAEVTSNPSSMSGSMCTTLNLNSDSTKYSIDCNQEMPFLCQYFTGTCKYRIYEKTSIVAHNVFTKTAINLKRCYDLCESVTEFICRSFEFNPTSQYCQLSDENRWTVPDKFAYYVSSWDYYHKTCITAREYQTNDNLKSSTEFPINYLTTNPPETTSSKYEKTLQLIPLQIIYYNIALPWKDAHKYCQSKGGNLTILYDDSILHESMSQDLQKSYATVRKDKTWIGLTRLVTNQWHWVDGKVLAKPNWKYEPNEYDFTEACASALLAPPFSWYAERCADPKPFICQYSVDTCKFQRTEESILVANNILMMHNVTETECLHFCNISDEFICRSFEYNINTTQCQLSDVNRWSAQDYFLQDMPLWTYYHRKCYFGEDDFPTTTAVTATSFTTDSTDADTTTTGDITSRVIKPTTKIPFMQRKKELEEIGVRIREKNRKASHSSALDERPSATGVGVVAIIILASFLGGIVFSDIGTIAIHCKYIRNGGNKKPKMKYLYKNSVPNNETIEKNRDRNGDENETESNVKGDGNENILMMADIRIENPTQHVDDTKQYVSESDLSDVTIAENSNNEKDRG